MGHCIFVGCDVHAKTMLLRYAVDRGEVQQRSYRNHRRARAAMVRWLTEEADALGDAQVHFAYEASGLGFTLHDELAAAGFACWVLAPTKIERSPQQRRNKCDAKDAQRLLDLLRAHVLAGTELPSVWVPDRETRDAREVVRGRLRTADKLTAVRNEVRSLIQRSGLERPARTGKGWTKAYWAWLDGLVDGGGALGWGAAVTLGSLLAQVRALEKERAYFEDQMAVLAGTPRYAACVKAMVGVKGVSLLTAMVVLTEMGALDRFSNRRQVGAFAGLVPSKSESGETDDRKGHITRQGPPRVRRVLGQAAWSWVRWDKGAKTTYERLVARNPNKRKKIALVAMMRRLLIRLWHLGREAQAASPPPSAAQGCSGTR